MVHRKCSFLLLFFVLFFIFILQSSKVTAQVETNKLMYEGKDYTIELMFTDGANISQNACLEVTEIYEGSEEYKEYFSETNEFMKETEEKTISFARFFDICIVENDKKIEPDDNVEVTIKYEQGIEKEQQDAVAVIHFVENGTKEFIEVDTEQTSNGSISEINFLQDSFSVIGMIVFDQADTGVKNSYSNDIYGVDTIHVEKEWSDGAKVHVNDNVTISLYEMKDKIYVNELNLNHSNGWCGEFKNLDENKKYVIKETKVSTKNGENKSTYQSVITNTSEKKWIPKEENKFRDGENIILTFGDKKKKLLRRSSSRKEINLRTNNIEIVQDNNKIYCNSKIELYQMWNSIWNDEHKMWQLYNEELESYLALLYNVEKDCYEWATSNENTEGSYLEFSEGKISATVDGVKKYLGNVMENGPYKALDENEEGITEFQIFVYDIYNPGYYKIRNIKNETVEEEMIDADIKTGKNIDYLGDGANNPDTDVDDKNISKKILNDLYRLNLTLEMKTDVTGLDLLMVIDVSSSMKMSVDSFDEDGNKITRAEALRQALNEFVPEFLSGGSKNRLSIVAFETESVLLQEWTNNPDEILEKVNYEVDGELPLYKGEGTNYEAALVRAHEALSKCGYSSNKKALVFLSDGEPTAYLKGNDSLEPGNVTVDLGDAHVSDSGIEGTLSEGIYSIFTAEDRSMAVLSADEAIQSFHLHNPEIMIGTIAFNTKVTNSLKNLATDEKFVSFIENGTPSDLIKAMGLITKFKPEKIVVTDELSENVELYENEPDFKIDVTDENGKKTILYDAENKLTEAGKDVLDANKPIEIRNPFISVNFREDYDVKNEYLYTISFNVKISQIAYDKFADCDGQYSEKGDNNTDYKGNETSSLKSGFYSNGDNSKVTYEMNGAVIEKKYSKPVIQVKEGEFTVKKVDQNGKVISKGTEFTLYRAADDKDSDTDIVLLQNVADQCVEVAKGITDESGKVRFEHLRLSVFDTGYPYYLVETDAPKGYKKLEKAVKIYLFADHVEIREDKESVNIADTKNEIQVINEEYVDFTFLKVSAEDDNQELTGAKFQLYDLVCTLNKHVHADECWVLVKVAESMPEVNLKSLIAGHTFKLKEIEAPDGFLKPEEEWRIIVTNDGQIETDLRQLEDGTYVLENEKEKNMPVTGGDGIWKYYVTGILLITGGIWMLNEKKISRFLVLFMAVIMGFHMVSMTSFAIDNTEKGTITINGIEKGVSVSAYRLMDINYDYDVDQPKNPMYMWVDEIKTWMESNYPEFIDTNNNNAVNEDFSKADEVVVSELYDKLAVAIKDGTVNIPVKDVEAASDSVLISELTMGNYFILIEGGLKVYRPLSANVVPQWQENGWEMTSPSITAKASEPSITKVITENLKKDNVNVGDTVTYELSAVVPSYPKNANSKMFVVSDQLSEGLTLVEDSIKVYGVNSGKEDTLMETGFTKTAEKTDCFELDFDYDAISKFETVKVTYNTVLNEKAIIGGDGNKNTATLKYSNNPYVKDDFSTDRDETTVYSYGLNILKVDEETEKGLSGAEFTLAKDGKEILFNGNDGRYCVSETDGKGSKIIIVDENGLLVVDGLDEGTYVLTEVKAPEGYVKLQNSIEIEITDEDLNGKVEVNEEEMTDGYVPLTVKNDKGFTLPVTGGMGTTLFSLTGGALAGCGIVMLIVCLRKRKNQV